MAEEFVTPFMCQHISDSIDTLRLAAKTYGGRVVEAIGKYVFARPLVFAFPDRDQYLAFLGHIGDTTNPDKRICTLIRHSKWKVRAQFFYNGEFRSPTKEVVPTTATLAELTKASGPMLVRIMASTCRHCVSLKENWDAIEADVRKIIPNLRTVEIELPGFGKTAIDGIYPSDLNAYTIWFPMTLLINGNLWDHAVAAHKRCETARLREGVLINSGAWIDGGVRYVKAGHDTVDVLGWVRSLSSAQLESLTGPMPELKVETPATPPAISASSSEGPLEHLVINQSIVQSTYDVLGQIKSLTSHPLRRFLAQAVIQEMAPYL